MSKKGRIILISSLAALLIIGLGGWWIFTHSIDPSKKADNTTVETPGTAAVSASETLYNKAVQVASSQGPAAGQAVLDTELKKTSDPKSQATIYTSKVSLATSAGGGTNYTDALTYALKSEQLDPTSDSASAVAFCYQQLKDNSEAIKYYQLAIDRIGNFNSADNMTQADYTYYQSMIKELQ